MNHIIARASLTPAISRIAVDGALNTPPSRRALIVGGTRGIGRGVACALARKHDSTVVEIVGRDESAAKSVIGELRTIREAKTGGGSTPSSDSLPDQSDQYKFWEADLSTLSGCEALVSRLGVGNTSPYDLLVFTVGAWPEFGNPLTSEGFPRVAFLDVLARFRILSKMIEGRLLAAQNAVVLSVLACGQTNKTFAGLDLAGRQDFLQDGVIKRRTGEEAEQYSQRKNFMATLQTAGCAHDIMLCAAARKYAEKDLRMVGTFPGLVDTGVSAALLGNSLTSVANFFATWVPGGMVSVDVAGDQHIAVLDEVRRRMMKCGKEGGEAGEGKTIDSIEDKAVSFWDAALGREHEIPQYVSDEISGDWLFAELEKL